MFRTVQEPVARDFRCSLHNISSAALLESGEDDRFVDPTGREVSMHGIEHTWFSEVTLVSKGRNVSNFTC